MAQAYRALVRENYKPEGHCPHCGYALDPGVCPECGETVSADDIDDAAWRQRRWHRVRIVARWAGLLVIVIGAYYYVRDINFRAKIPTKWLLTLDKQGAEWASRELWSARFCSGELSTGDAATFLRQQVTISPLLATSPHPSTESVCFRISVPNVEWFQHTQWDPVIAEWHVSIDGEPVPYTAESYRFAGDVRTEHYCIRVCPLRDGLHTAEVSGTCTLTTEHAMMRSHAVICGEDRPSPSFTFSRSLELEIKKGLLSDFVQPAWTEELAETVSSRVKVGVFGVPGKRWTMMFISRAPLPVPLVGLISILPTGCDEDKRVPTRIAFPAGSQGALPLWNPQPDGADGVQSVDVVIVPDAKLALDSGFTEYFGGVLEWTAVPNRLPDSLDADANSASGDEFAPTSVRKHDGLIDHE